ncbi:MAG: hypothetical protein AAGL23_03455 [Pseudomonadota bacterium]
MTKASGICLALATAASPAVAQSSLEVSGQIDFGTRAYVNDGLYVGQSTSRAYGVLGFSLDGGFDVGADGDVAFSFSGLAEEGNDRSYYNIERLYYRHVFSNWDILVGFNTENWGVVESSSVLNVINPRANADPVAGDTLLGTPMINVNVYTRAGTFSAYALTGFIEPFYGDERSRFRAPIIPDYESTVFEEGSGRHLDYALRYSNSFSAGQADIDVAASFFSGTDRSAVCSTTGTGATSCADAILTALGNPPGSPAPGSSTDAFFAFLEANANSALLANASGVPVPGLQAFYQEVDQFGLSGVYTRNDLQLRFEASHTDTSTGSYFAGVVGGDYTWNDVFGGPGSLTMAVEYLYDDRNSAQGIPLFEDDVFLGLQYRFNNPLDSVIDFSVFHDLTTSAKLYRLGVSSRITDRVGVALNASAVDTDGFDDPLAFIRQDNFVELMFSAYF